MTPPLALKIHVGQNHQVDGKYPAQRKGSLGGCQEVSASCISASILAATASAASSSACPSSSLLSVIAFAKSSQKGGVASSLLSFLQIIGLCSGHARPLALLAQLAKRLCHFQLRIAAGFISKIVHTGNQIAFIWPCFPDKILLCGNIVP